MAKAKPSLYAPPIEASDLKRGKYAGYCKGCSGLLCELDKVDDGYKCPRCGTTVKTPEKTKKESTTWS